MVARHVRNELLMAVLQREFLHGSLVACETTWFVCMSYFH